MDGHGAGLQDTRRLARPEFSRVSRCLARGSPEQEARQGIHAPEDPRGPCRIEGQDMFNHHKVEIEWAGRPLVLETGKIARQADGAVLATYGETVVLATVVSAKEPKPGLDFFPLTVNYQERPTRPARSPVAISSAKAVRARRKRWFPASSTARSVRFSPPATRMTRRSSSPCCSTIWKTIRTSCRSSPPRLP